MILRRLAVFAAVLFLLGGCALFESRADRAQQKLPNYKAGYSDGCSSAGAQGGIEHGDMVRDDALFAADKAYRAGWHTGFGACRTNFGGGNGPLPDNSPGAK